jgi:hypothetical protein
MQNFLDHLAKSCHTKNNSNGTQQKISPTQENPGTFNMMGVFLRSKKNNSGTGSSFSFIAIDVIKETKVFRGYQEKEPCLYATPVNGKTVSPHLKIICTSERCGELDYFQRSKTEGYIISPENANKIRQASAKSKGKRKFIFLKELSDPIKIFNGDVIWASTFSSLDEIIEGDIITISNCQITRPKIIPGDLSSTNAMDEQKRLFFSADCKKNQCHPLNDKRVYTRYKRIFGANEWAKLPVINTTYLNTLMEKPSLKNEKLPLAITCNNTSDETSKYITDSRNNSLNEEISQRCGSGKLVNCEAKHVFIGLLSDDPEELQTLGVCGIISDGWLQGMGAQEFLVKMEKTNKDVSTYHYYHRNLLIKQCQWDSNFNGYRDRELPEIKYTFVELDLYGNHCQGLGFSNDETTARFLKFHEVPFHIIYNIDPETSLLYDCNSMDEKDRIDEMRGGYIKCKILSIAWDLLGYVKKNAWVVTVDFLKNTLKSDIIKLKSTNTNQGAIGTKLDPSDNNSILQKEGIICLNETLEQNDFEKNGSLNQNCINSLKENDYHYYILFDDDKKMGINDSWPKKKDCFKDHGKKLIEIVRNRLESPFPENTEMFYKSCKFFQISNLVLEKEKEKEKEKKISMKEVNTKFEGVLIKATIGSDASKEGLDSDDMRESKSLQNASSAEKSRLERKDIISVETTENNAKLSTARINHLQKVSQPSLLNSTREDEDEDEDEGEDQNEVIHDAGIGETISNKSKENRFVDKGNKRRLQKEGKSTTRKKTKYS